MLWSIILLRVVDTLTHESALQFMRSMPEETTEPEISEPVRRIEHERNERVMDYIDIPFEERFHRSIPQRVWKLECSAINTELDDDFSRHNNVSRPAQSAESPKSAPVWQMELIRSKGGSAMSWKV